jgi:nucleotide-binding universal stress UspA family protein
MSKTMPTETDATRMGPADAPNPIAAPTPADDPTPNSGGTSEARGIVVGIDGSEASKAALRWAAGQARVTGATLRVIMTWEIPTFAYASGMAYPGDLDLAAGSRRSLDKALRENVTDLEGVEVSSVVVEGHPAVALLEQAAEAELLVVGTRGHGAFAGMLLGSVSEHCVAHSSCPVVVVPPDAAPAGGR